MAEGAVEVWRGSVAAWELDNMGHLNVRYYGQRVIEGLVTLAAAMGMPDAFAADAGATLLVKEQHIRFLREARSAAPLHMTGGVVEMGETDATLLLELFHFHSGAHAATYLLKVAHVTARDLRPFAWSQRTLEAAGRLRVELPPQAGPRSIPGDAVDTAASLAESERLGLVTMSLGAFGMQDCDVFGRMRPELVISRISDGMPILLGEGSRGGGGEDEKPGRPIGGAVLEYRLIHWDWPRAGDRFVVRSGVARVEERAQHLVHWMLDPATGRPWATSQALAISLDLEARKIVAYTPEHRAALEERVAAGLAL